MPRNEVIKMFSENLKRILNERGKSQKWLAEQTGFTEVSISRYVNGSRLPSAYAVRKICNALNCSADELLEIEQPNINKGKHGKWVQCEYRPHIYFCSLCGEAVECWSDAEKRFPYSHCGAKMDAEDET